MDPWVALKSLYGALCPPPTPDHVIRLFAKRGETRVGDYARSFAELERFVKACEGMNIYVALNPTKSTVGTRHNANDVTHWRYFPLDIDPVEPEANPVAATEHVLERAQEWFGINLEGDNRPTLIDSGRGIQVWMRLPDYDLNSAPPIELPEGVSFRKAVRKAMSHWLHRFADDAGTLYGCRVDTTCSDLPRVMRCPGTVNTKTGRVAKIRHTHVDPYPTLGPTILSVPSSALVDPVGDTTQLVGKSWQEAFPYLTRKAQSYLLEGKEDPGRHETLWHTLQKFQEIGLDVTQAQAAVYHADKLRGEQYELGKLELDKVIKQVYGD